MKSIQGDAKFYIGRYWNSEENKFPVGDIKIYSQMEKFMEADITGWPCFILVDTVLL